jgi:hypothetical protein
MRLTVIKIDLTLFRYSQRIKMSRIEAINVDITKTNSGKPAVPEQRAKRFPPKPVSKTPIVPADVRQFAPRKARVGALPARALSIEIPSFLKRGPRMEET